MNNDSKTINDKELMRRHCAFAGFLIVSVLICFRSLTALIGYSLGHESASHILLIPIVSVYLLFTERKNIFRIADTSLGIGSALISLGVLSCLLSYKLWSAAEGNSYLSGITLGLVIMWLGGFIGIYGIRAARQAAFPLLFLLLFVPLPDVVLAKTVYLLQEGSTDVTQFLFKVCGVPVWRQGFILSVPGATIEVAEECSGIRSSLAMLITCLLAAHLLLRTRWRMLVFVTVTIPLAIIKNGIRISTLTLLSIYVDRGFLTGRLHHEGGFVFFLLALAMQLPILLYCRKAERKQSRVNPTVPKEVESDLPGGG